MINMQDPDFLAGVAVPFFLRSLLRIERERAKFTVAEAAQKSNWQSEGWAVLEDGSEKITIDNWQVIRQTLNLEIEHTVRRLNAFISKHPVIWLEHSSESETTTVCKRPVTSPRAIKSGRIVTVDMNRIRPSLYYELSRYFNDEESVIESAIALGHFVPVYSQTPSRPPRSFDHDQSREGREDFVSSAIDRLSDEKLGLLERVVDKFEKYPARELAIAYRHFSLSLTDR